MKLIKYEDFQIKLADEAFLIRPIRRLFNADRSERKEQFWRQMSYMYFMCSPASTYSYILDLDERARTIIEQEGLPSDFTPSQLLVEAMQIYRQHTVTVSQKLLSDALVAADKVGKFLREVNLNEEDDKGRPKYQVSNITAALKNVEPIISTLQNLQKKVEAELEEDSGKARGTQELTLGDVGLD
jgi:hypothetical protein